MRLVRERDRAQMTGVPRSTCYLRMKQGTFPKPVPIGEKAVAWLESDLIGWMEQQVSKRDGSEA
jgi:prophage regulatory protein